jgi:hypothetical protein
VDEEVAHRPMIETIINQSKVVTLDNKYPRHWPKLSMIKRSDLHSTWPSPT